MHGVVGVLVRGDRLLLIQRSNNVRAGGMWCFPGGEIESGESADQAIVREFREEVGLEVTAHEKLWECTSHDGRLHLQWWRVYGDSLDLCIDESEVQTFEWVTVDELRSWPDLLPNNLAFLDQCQQRLGV